MHRHPLRTILAALLALIAPAGFTPPTLAAPPEATVHHDIRVEADPSAGRIAVTDRLRLPPDLSGRDGSADFVLHAGLRPEVVGGGARLKRLGPVAGHPDLERFRLRLAKGEHEVGLRYAGQIDRPRRRMGQDATGTGPVSPSGIHLDGASYWYPVFEDAPVSFSIEVHLPPGWSSVSQGMRERGGAVDRWTESRPQRDIQLIAAAFHEYRDDTGPVALFAFLRTPDEALARRYLEVTGHYIDLYSRMIGPYPYEKFAMVEDVWDSGLGMPSFTLLGERVIRLPFILHTSYPHEILHNWWGNGVYIDYESGNWGEGLTSYLADHLQRELAGGDAGHRRAALQRYADYVTGERDFPLTEFRSRHTNIAQAIGYDKTLMLFHMLRRTLGDEAFLASLRRLYDEHLSRRAAFTDVRAAFEAATARDLGAFFQQWVERPGAPELRVSDARAQTREGGWRLSFVLEQVQADPPYDLEVPVAVQLEGQAQAWTGTVRLNGRRAEAAIDFPARPWRLHVDPQFDLMRRLDHREIPVSFSRLFGAEAVLVLLPGDAPKPLRYAYLDITAQIAGEAHMEVRWDHEARDLPAGRSIWLLGWENRHLSALKERLAAYGATIDPAGTTLPGHTLPRGTTGTAMVLPHPGDARHAVAVVAFDDVDGLTALARRLRHYGRYGHLAFEGTEARNTLHGEWTVTDSPLSLDVAQPDGAEPPVSQSTFPARPTLLESMDGSALRTAR